MLASTSIQAQDIQLLESIARFELYTACAPVGLVIEGLHSDATDIGLTRNAITTTVRSRLRGARIYSPKTINAISLYINVNVVRRAFSSSLEFRKFLLDPEHDTSGTATTWSIGTTGAHGQNPEYILQLIGRQMDQFIDEYLAVNEDAYE